MPKSRNKRLRSKKKRAAHAPRPKADVIPLPDPRAMERMFSSFALAGGEPSEGKRQAQELIYDAWETPDPKSRITMAHHALKLWPDCADAWCILAEDTARSVKELAECFEQGIRAGERALGERTFEEDVGHFWGLLETRPYMRARAGYAQTLERLDRQDEAVEHYRELLRLNPNDNQGIRYLLLRALVSLDRDEEAWKLHREYGDEGTASWCFNKALLAYRAGGQEEADSLLHDAIQVNRYVPDYLLGRSRMPKYLPDYIGVGDKDEAVAYAAENKANWKSTSGAIEWLKAVQSSH